MTARRHLRRMGAAALGALAIGALARAVTLPDGPAAGPAPAVQTAAGHPHAASGIVAAPRRVAQQLPVPALVTMIPAGRPSIRVPILMYHYVRVNPDARDRIGFNLSVTPGDFSRQMDWLAGSGYHPIDFDDLRGYLLGHDALPSRPVVLTFDDGYRDLYTAAYPVLRAHRFKAVAYVPAGFVNSPASITAEQVLEMDANGIQIGAHSVSHADLVRLSPADVAHEVRDSRSMLEALLGHPVLDFCYPYGHVNEAVRAAVEAAGFQTATTTQPGVVHAAGDRFLWPRVRVSGGEPLEQLAADMGAPEPGDLVAPPRPPPAPLHGPARLPVTAPLRPPREWRPGAPPTEGALP
jgi:peptidoglycan/xylan/chitin deacetylase (PgdA/CDA1 family)